MAWFRALSVDSVYIPRIKFAVSKIKSKDAEKISNKMLSFSKIDDITRILETIEKKYKDNAF